MSETEFSQVLKPVPLHTLSEARAPHATLSILPVCSRKCLVGSVGLLVCRFVGLSACQSVDLYVSVYCHVIVCQSFGLLVCRSVGLMLGLSACQSVDLYVSVYCIAMSQSVSLLVCWSVGLLVSWLVCPPVNLSICMCRSTVLPCHSLTVFRSVGLSVCWSHGWSVRLSICTCRSVAMSPSVSLWVRRLPGTLRFELRRSLSVCVWGCFGLLRTAPGSSCPYWLQGDVSHHTARASRLRPNRYGHMQALGTHGEETLSTCMYPRVCATHMWMREKGSAAAVLVDGGAPGEHLHL